MSPESFDDDERALARALHGKVDDMNDAPLSAQDIEDRAHGIRRSRVALAGAGIAAALAIIVPTALLAGGAFDSSPPPVTTQSPSPTRSEATDPSITPSPTASGTPVLDVGDLATGAAPGLAWIEADIEDGNAVGGTLHTVDGANLELPPLGPAQFAQVGDRFAVLMYDVNADVEQVYLIDAQTGSYGDPLPASGGLATSPGGQVVAWAQPNGTVYVVQASSGDLTMPAIPGPGPFNAVGVSSEDCKEGRSTDAGCSILVNTPSRTGRQRVYVTTSHGIVERLPYQQATTSFQDLFGGLTSVDEMEPGSCSDLATLAGQTLWQTCDNTLGVFAPDGRHLVGLPSYLDGFGPNSLDLLDASDGRPVRSWTWDPQGKGATYFSEVWEDESHLLAVTYQDQQWAVVRFGVDGSLEYAIPPVDDRTDMQNPFILQTR